MVTASRRALGLCVALLACALATDGAAAQEPQRRSYELSGRPVRGGGSYQQAPKLGPGAYRDAMFPDEVVWFAVDVREGQQLAVSSTIAPVDPEIGEGTFVLQVFGPDLEEVSGGHAAASGVGPRPQSLGVRVGPVTADEEAFGEPRPGTYYLRFTLDGDQLVGNELGYELVVSFPGESERAGPLGLALGALLALAGIALGAAGGWLAVHGLRRR